MTTPYYENRFDQWRIIRTGQRRSTAGAHRWEAVNINGWAVFNNGRDLPCTYRVGDYEALPIYEMREAGIAWVETIGEVSGVMCAGNVAEIPSNRMGEWFQFRGVTMSGQTTLTQSGTTVTASADIFTATMVNQYIKLPDGTLNEINAYTSARVVTCGTSDTIIDPTTFEVWPAASQTGATYSSTTKASMTTGSATVTATTSIFTALMIGKYVWFNGGFHKKITALVGASPSNQCTLESAATYDITAETFFVVYDPVDYTVNSLSAIFSSDMVGLSIMWDDGTTRKITAYVDANNVKVDSYVGIGLGVIGIENVNIYEAYPHDNLVNKIGYKMLCGMAGEPRRWAAQGLGAIQAGSRVLHLRYPMKSLAQGHQIVINGAGIDGGNLTATIDSVFGLNTHFNLSVPAATTVSDAIVIRADAVTSTIGAYYVMDDASEILRLLACRGELVIYKETSMHLAHYTGDVTEPFQIKRLTIPEGRTLHYPWSLVSVEGIWHFYAGSQGIYRFDLVDQIPVPLDTAELCKDIFFNVSGITQKNNIWSAVNTLTSEVWFIFPNSGSDKGIAFDYLHSRASTIGYTYTSAGMIKRPFTDKSEDWFILGTPAGVVLSYGKFNYYNAIWGGRKQIYFRRDTNPYAATRSEYESHLASGLADLGDPSSEKEWTAWTPHAASQERTLEAVSISVDFKGARNVAEAPKLLATKLITDPKTENNVPLYACQYCLQDIIRVSGFSPFNLSRRVWEVKGADTRNLSRREASE